MPTHAAIVLAITPLQDAELRGWTTSPESYALVAEQRVRLPGYRLWHLGPHGVSTPVGVLLAEEESTGRTIVTSQRAATVAELLLGATEVSDQDLALLFFHLWRDPGRPQEPVPGSLLVSRADGLLRLDLEVVDRWSRRERWHADLGPSLAEVHTLPIPEGAP